MFSHLFAHLDLTHLAVSVAALAFAAERAKMAAYLHVQIKRLPPAIQPLANQGVDSGLDAAGNALQKAAPAPTATIEGAAIDVLSQASGK